MLVFTSISLERQLSCVHLDVLALHVKRVVSVSTLDMSSCICVRVFVLNARVIVCMNTHVHELRFNRITLRLAFV